jgi:hypothetical protein
MKKFCTSVAFFSLLTMISAHLVHISNNMHTGLSFNLYSRSGINTAILAPSGANITWDLGTTAAALAGTSAFLEMASTPYATAYPATNFAMKFTFGAVTQ